MENHVASSTEELLSIARAGFEEIGYQEELLRSGYQFADSLSPSCPVREIQLAGYVYENIYYSCHPCNNIKRDIWPTDELRAKGYRFVDPCYDDFSTHFTEVDGRWEPLTPAGDYSQERLRLNREHLIKIRRMLVQMLNKLGALPLDWNQPLRQQIAPLIHLISDL